MIGLFLASALAADLQGEVIERGNCLGPVRSGLDRISVLDCRQQRAFFHRSSGRSPSSRDSC